MVNDALSITPPRKDTNPKPPTPENTPRPPLWNGRKVDAVQRQHPFDEIGTTSFGAYSDTGTESSEEMIIPDKTSELPKKNNRRCCWMGILGIGSKIKEVPNGEKS